MNDDPRSQRGRPEGPVRPALRPTNPATLIVAALATAGLAWLGMSRYYASVPDINWLPGITSSSLAMHSVTNSVALPQGAFGNR